MTLTAASTILYVDLPDADGYATGQVPVQIDYVQEVDASWGEDADGNRGICLVEYSILDAYIEADQLKTLTAGQAKQAIDEAQYIFNHSQKHW